MKKAIGTLVFAAAALTWSTADAQNNVKSQGNTNNIQVPRPDEGVVVQPQPQPQTQPPVQLPPQDRPVIVDQPVPAQRPEEKNGRFGSKEEQRQHAEERSGGRAFSGNGNNGNKTKNKVKKTDPGGGFTVVKYKEDKKSKKTKVEKDPYAKKPKKRKRK